MTLSDDVNHNIQINNYNIILFPKTRAYIIKLDQSCERESHVKTPRPFNNANCRDKNAKNTTINIKLFSMTVITS